MEKVFENCAKYRLLVREKTWKVPGLNFLSDIPEKCYFQYFTEMFINAHCDVIIFKGKAKVKINYQKQSPGGIL